MDSFSKSWESPLEQRDGAAFAMRHLLERALARCFVGTPAHNFGAVPKTPASEMIVGHFDDDFRLDRFPLAGALGTPATRAARRISGESRRFP